MELALYCPKIGFYEWTQPTIGRAGAYYTSVSVGALFGELLAFQFARWLEELPVRPAQLVEAGAHDGRLAADILAWLRGNRPSVWDRLEYWIIEPSPERQTWQRRRLEDFAGRVRWFDSFAGLPASGADRIIFSSELLDAFPVHRLGWDAARGQWFEWGVTRSGDRFVWARMSPDPHHWSAEMRRAGLAVPPELLAVLPDGFTIELCPAAAAWWEQAAARLSRGKLLTLDYGLTDQEFWAPERTQGTLRAYYRHHVSEDVLARPGEQDLTAHVNFSQLQQAGEAAGLRTEGLFAQAQFLTRIAEQVWRADPPGNWPPARMRQFQTLIHPAHLGQAFRVLIQSRS